MPSYPFLRIVPALAIIAVLMSSAAGLQFIRERRFPPPPATEEVLYVTSGPAARRLAVGYQTLAADLYWIRAIQHYGGTRRANVSHPEQLSNYPLLYPLLDLTTSLDPYFNIAYRFGAIFLAEPAPNGPGRPDLAIQLLEKGLSGRPDKWEYMWDIGFVHYRSHQYQAAAEWFRRGSDVPGAAWWLRSLAAVTLAEGGDRRSSRLMWEAIRESADNDWMRQEADRRLQQLNAMDGIDVLQAVVDRMAAETGRKPADWNALVAAGALRGIPADPTGVPYTLDADGRVGLSMRSELYPLPEEPQGGQERRDGREGQERSAIPPVQPIPPVRP